MTGLNPDALGWTEFWLRIGVMAAVLSVVALVAAMAVRIILDVRDGVGWILRKAKREEGR